MRKTYAYNSIIFGILLGILVYTATMSAALAILTCIGVSIVGFIIIRAIENAIDKGVDKASEKIREAHQRRKLQKAVESGAYVRTAVTKMPQRETPKFPGQIKAQNTASVAPKFSYCERCGAKLESTSAFCYACGTPVKE